MPNTNLISEKTRGLKVGSVFIIYLEWIRVQVKKLELLRDQLYGFRGMNKLEKNRETYIREYKYIGNFKKKIGVRVT